MSAVAFVTIWCNWPGCTARIETSYTKIPDGRKYAKEHGWINIGNMVDLCGKPEQAELYSTKYPESWSGHSSRIDHRPSIRPAQKGEVYLGCSCGWIVPARYSWDSVGITARTSADYRWEEHIKEIKNKENS